MYAWMRYALEPSDPYAIVSHPAQPLLQHGHVWSAPFLVFAVGLIWQQHVWRHWRQGSRGGRRTGLALLASAAPMILSGYLIQTAVTPAWRTAWIAVHLAASSVWIAGSIGHALAGKNGQRPPQGDSRGTRHSATAHT